MSLTKQMSEKSTQLIIENIFIFIAFDASWMKLVLKRMLGLPYQSMSMDLLGPIIENIACECYLWPYHRK